MSETATEIIDGAITAQNVKEINKKLLSKRAIEEMLSVHAQKYIKAWLDKIQYSEKIEELKRDWNLVGPEAKTRVENFIDKRLANPEGTMIPENEISHAVTVRLGLDSVTQEFKNACIAFDFYARIIKMIKEL